MIQNEPTRTLEDLEHDQVRDAGELKMALNNAIWMYAPAGTTLAVAEDAAVTALSIINGGKYQITNPDESYDR